MASSRKKVRFIQPRNTLKQKVGGGGIDPRLIEQAQSLIDDGDFDFIPMAQEMVKHLGQKILEAKKDNISDAEAVKTSLNNIAISVMRLKGSGGMFQYQLISDVAEVSLTFLENLEVLNDDVFEILDAHKKTLEAIIARDLKGRGGPEGTALINELHQASTPYFSKHTSDEAE